nr:MAG TPA: hypothetical protein [Caudoviricetes sp.]
MTCNDCIHQTACFDWCRGFGQEAELCEHFSDKAEWVHLPCNVGDRVFTIVIIGGEYSVVADRVHAIPPYDDSGNICNGERSEINGKVHWRGRRIKTI